MFRIGKLGAEQRGSSLVEMAIGSLVLVLVLAGVADLGRAFHSGIAISNAAREGARYAARYPTYLDGIRAATKQEGAAGGVSLTDGNITVGSLGAISGAPISVTVTYPYTNTVMSGITRVETINLRASVTMVVFGTK